MTEDEWFKHWNILNSEVEKATEAFYRWKAVDSFAAGSEGALAAMNQQPQFWITVSDALQTTYIIGLGRIFDSDQRAHSIDRFLADTAQHPEFFSVEALRRRKVAASGGEEREWLPERLAEAWSPEADDLKRLRGAIKPLSRKWQDIYFPIRSRMFAHRERDVDSQRLLERTKMADLEDILHGLKDVLSAALQMYANGRQPQFRGERDDVEQRITAETHAVMARLTG